MTIEELEKDWNKYTSIMFLETRGINVPKVFGFTTDKGLLKDFFYENPGKKFSFRTLRKDRISFSEPFFPNVALDYSIIEALCDLIDGGYYIIISDSIDPEGTLFKGNLLMRSKNNWMIEGTYGKGTVRDLEFTKPDKVIVMVKGDDLTQLGTLSDRFRQLVMSGSQLFWGVPIIIEFSIYKFPVGVKNESLIYWELRKG